jgi:hypothetical protein
VTATCTFTAPLWQWQAKEGTAEPGSWCFVTVPLEDSQDIRDGLVAPPRGFGSVRVAVEAGSSRWDTSVFPDSASGCYVLPIKKAVRVAERVEEGDDLTVTLTVRDVG